MEQTYVRLFIEKGEWRDVIVLNTDSVEVFKKTVHALGGTVVKEEPWF